jgi:hypothetical protein
MPVTRARLVTPSDEALTRVAIRYAVALRLGGTAACTVAAPLAVTGVPAAVGAQNSASACDLGLLVWRTSVAWARQDPCSWLCVWSI